MTDVCIQTKLDVDAARHSARSMAAAASPLTKLNGRAKERR